jgi:hypothetical protein
MEKVDFKKFYSELYNPPRQPVLVDVPEMGFLMVNGTGDPNTALAYREALEVLYAIAYSIKFALKKSGGSPEFFVPPLEGLWWSDDMEDFLLQRKDKWSWTAMIMQPETVTEAVFRQALAETEKKKALPALDKIRLERFQEGLSAQVLHLGSYAAEAPTIEQLHSFIRAQGHQLRGKHHEIYLGDPRKTAPEKLRTVIRQPVSLD